jgi:hypothetical protein
MILRIWHLSDAPEYCLGSPYLHREVEDWIGTQIDGIPEEEWEAPDFAKTDPAGLTIFMAAFGLNQVSIVDVHGMGRLAEYPGELVFVGLAQKTVIVEQADHSNTIEIKVDTRTGIRTPVLPSLAATWHSPETRLRLRGLVVDKTTKQQTLDYVESRAVKQKGGQIDLML